MQQVNIYDPIIQIKPVYIGNALEYFFDNATINVYHENTSINLIDLFPILKQRYTFPLTVELIQRCYILYHNLNHGHDLGLIIPDNLFYQAFGTNIAAEILTYIDPELNILTGITMDQAVTSGIIPNPINTFDSVRSGNNNFVPEMFKSYFLSNLNGVNYINPIIELTQELIDAMTEEFLLAGQMYTIFNLFRQINQPLTAVTLNDFINIARANNLQHIITRFTI